MAESSGKPGMSPKGKSINKQNRAESSGTPGTVPEGSQNSFQTFWNQILGFILLFALFLIALFTTDRITENEAVPPRMKEEDASQVPEGSQNSFQTFWNQILGFILLFALYLIAFFTTDRITENEAVPPRMKEEDASQAQKIKKKCTAIDGLSHAQTCTAYFLHLSFLVATDHPDISRLIRSCANGAQQQHSRVLECMVQCTANSKHVIDTLLPMILEGIDKEMPELITGAFEEIMMIAEEMHSDTTETVKRYDEIQVQVQETMAKMKTEHDELEKYSNEIGECKRVAKERAELAGDRVEKETAGAANYTREYDRHCRQKDTLSGEYSRAREQETINDKEANSVASMLFPTELAGTVAAGLTGTLSPVAAATLLIAGFAGIGVHVWNEVRKTKNKRERTEEGALKMEECEAKIESTLKEQREQEECILKCKEKQLAAVHEVEKIALEEDNVADVTGLKTAHGELGQVYAQLMRLKVFWGQIVVYIRLINKDTRVAHRYKERSALLREKVKQLELNWKTLIDVCDKYVNVCKNDDTKSIKKMYAFLSEPMDSMTKDQRKERQANIIEELKRGIQELGNA